VYTNRLRALELASGLEPTAGAIQKIAKITDADSAAWAFLQWDLRRRARAKFAEAEKMIFVKEALEQATHEAVARYHASHFPKSTLVADLTCGIGADLIALARRGATIGFDLDSERLESARFNLEALQLLAETRCEDSLQVEWNFEYAMADPARRVAGRRTLDPTQFEPNPTVLCHRMSKLKLGLIKLSPAMADSFFESLECGLEFVSFGGECREALIQVGTEAKFGRWAVHLETGSRLSTEALAPSAVNHGEYLFDCDPAAVRAHALGTLCEQYDLQPLGDSNGYLVGNQIVESSWFRGYRVLYTGKGDMKTTRRILKELDARIFEIKVRGAKVDDVKLKRDLSSEGANPVSMVIWPDGASIKHSIVQNII